MYIQERVLWKGSFRKGWMLKYEKKSCLFLTSCDFLLLWGIMIKLKNLYGPIYGWGSTASRLEPLPGGSLHFTTKFPEINITHFIVNFLHIYLDWFFSWSNWPLIPYFYLHQNSEFIIHNLLFLDLFSMKSVSSIFF